jgi:thiol-disulfide isomerase/thioredoxin
MNLKELKLFYLPFCPYCNKAKDYLDELMKDERYSAISIRWIHEGKEKALADAHDYYLVPTFYDGDKKLHEGIVNKSQVRNILDSLIKV